MFVTVQFSVSVPKPGLPRLGSYVLVKPLSSSPGVTCPATRTRVRTPTRVATDTACWGSLRVGTRGTLDTTTAPTSSPGVVPAGTVMVTGNTRDFPPARVKGRLSIEVHLPTVVCSSAGRSMVNEPSSDVWASTAYMYRRALVLPRLYTITFSVTVAPGLTSSVRLGRPSPLPRVANTTSFLGTVRVVPPEGAGDGRVWSARAAATKGEATASNAAVAITALTRLTGLTRKPIAPDARIACPAFTVRGSRC